MKKVQIIKEIIGKRIEPYGFKYFKTENLEWIFIREAEEFKRYYDLDDQVVRQYLEILESRYEKTLTVRIYTDVSRRHRDDEEEEMRRAGIGNWFAYTDEDSFKTTLNQMADIIEKHGLDWLAKISQEEEAIVTKAMNEKLFLQHKELDREFIEEFHVKAVAQCGEDIDEWHHLIKSMIADIAGQPYEDVKEVLLKMTTSVMVFGDNYYAPISPLVCVKGEWDYKSKCEAQDEEKSLLAPIDLEQVFGELKRAFLEQEE